MRTSGRQCKLHSRNHEKIHLFHAYIYTHRDRHICIKSTCIKSVYRGHPRKPHTSLWQWLSLSDRTLVGRGDGKKPFTITSYIQKCTLRPISLLLQLQDLPRCPFEKSLFPCQTFQYPNHSHWQILTKHFDTPQIHDWDTRTCVHRHTVIAVLFSSLMPHERIELVESLPVREHVYETITSQKCMTS